MIDLTNKNVNELIQKYIGVLEINKNNEDIPFLAVIIDIGVNYIKTNHYNLPVDWKVWTIIFLRNKYLHGAINTESDIPVLINEFVKYYLEKYSQYIDDIAHYSSDFDRDSCFVNIYEKNR